MIFCINETERQDDNCIMSFRDFLPRNRLSNDGGGGGVEYRTPPQQLKKNTLRRAMSGGSNMMNSNGTPTNNYFSRPIPQRFDTIEFCRSRSDSDYAVILSMMVQKREEEYALHVLQQREE